MIMKIQKKEKQLPNFKVLTHSSMSDASITFECKPQSPFDESPDQEDLSDLVTISDLASVSLARKDHQNVLSVEVPSEIVQNMITCHNGMQDDGVGGTGVKKKRKKKELGQQDLGNEREVKPKRKREPKEPKDPQKPKQPKKPKEPKQEGAKKPRKPREPKVPKESKEKKNILETSSKAKPKKSRILK
uniref:Uncharacterized protein n=2 Tax=Micrurus lemniscatus lemniscatus TaxID=129467 RepID=A0A2D4I296_MICLE